MVRKCCDAIYKISGALITLGLFGIVALVFLQVVSRYVFEFSINWAQELTVYILIWLVFLGCSMGIRDGKVASLTIVTDRISEPLKRACAIIVNILLIAFFVITIYSNMEIIGFAMIRTSPVLKANMGLISSAFSVAAAITIIYCVEKLLALVGIIKEEDAS